ncbi:MAG: glycosyltransferase family 2 protein [bacterium]
MDIFLRTTSLLILAYFFIVSLVYVLLFLLSFIGLVRHHLRSRFATPNEILKAKITPPVSILAPAFNEEKNIVASVRSLLNLNYGQYEVIVINDGSKDSTLETLSREFSLRKTARDYHPQLPSKEIRTIYRSRKDPKLIVVDKDNGGKADSLNAGINVSSYPLFCCIDADSVLEPDSLLLIVHPFMEAYSQVVASGGLIRVANGCRLENGKVAQINTPASWLANFQIVEYFRAFLSGRMGLSMLNCLLVISGAFGLFKKEPVIEAGGYRTDIVGEDMELVIRLHHNMRKLGKTAKICFVPDPVCWTEVPENLKMLSRQRNRWQRGLAESLTLHAGMLFNPRYGTVGLIAMPYFFFMEFLSPVIELVGYIIFAVAFTRGAVDIYAVLAFLFFAIFFGIILSLLALLLEEITFRRYPRIKDLSKLILSTILENFGYRQYIALVRGKGIIDWLRGNKKWGEMERKGI